MAAEEFGGFNGQAYSPAGDKGRFVLPPDFRNPTKLSSDGRVVCLAKHGTLRCLVGFGLSRKPQLYAQLDREEEMAFRMEREFDRDAREAQLFGFSEVPFDASGRFVMPAHLRKLGAIEEGIFCHGSGSTFTIWNPDELMKMGDAWEGAKGACEELLAEFEQKASGK